MYIIDMHEKDDSIVKPKRLDFINEVTLKTSSTLKSSPHLDDSFGPNSANHKQLFDEILKSNHESPENTGSASSGSRQ
jgi:hypothetical protein